MQRKILATLSRDLDDRTKVNSLVDYHGGVEDEAELVIGLNILDPQGRSHSFGVNLFLFCLAIVLSGVLLV